MCGGKKKKKKRDTKIFFGAHFFSLSQFTLTDLSEEEFGPAVKQTIGDNFTKKRKKTVRLDFFGILVPPHPNQVRRAVPALCFFFPSFYFRFPLFSPLISVTSSGVLCCVIACLCRTRWSAEIQEREKKRESLGFLTAASLDLTILLSDRHFSRFSFFF